MNIRLTALAALALILSACGAGLDAQQIPSPASVATATPIAHAPGGQDPTPPPPSGENLPVNGDFSYGLTSWEVINGYWTTHRARPCEPTGTGYVQMDRDQAGLDTWPVGAHDWLWQDVAALAPHSRTVLRLIEAHHMNDGIAEVTLYGKAEWDEPWDVVFHRPDVESRFGTGKCGTHGPPAPFEYSILVSQAYAYYRLEIHGQMVNPDDAFLFGGFELVLAEG